MRSSKREHTGIIVLSINKSWSLYVLSQRISWGLSGLGQPLHTTRQFNEQAPRRRLLWLSEPNKKLFTFLRVLAQDPSVASYWKKDQRGEEPCFIHFRVIIWFSSYPTLSRGSVGEGPVLNEGHVAYPPEGPCAWNQTNNHWIHKDRKSFKPCLSGICTLACPEGPRCVTHKSD